MKYLVQCNPHGSQVSEPRIYPDPPEPDTATKIVRAVFGAVLGLALAAGLWIRLRFPSLVETLLLASCTVGFCVCAAVKLGDSFWESLPGRRWPWNWIWFD